MTTEQRNYLCASCHAKTTAPLTSSYLPGERFFDHFDLVTLESADYYPDGRDLGENYTYSSWLMSPCVKSGKLDCMHCHTSSGRYRFKKEEDSNKACLPCHEERVSNAPTHTRHEEKSSGNRCVSCHMPMTSFARMNRSDHSMLPPVPAATLVHQSPNACNLCHTAKDANWADQQVRTWHSRDYQAPVLRRTALIESARKRDWSKLPETLAAIDDPKSNEVFITSLIRLLAHCDNFEKVPVLLRAAANPSALVRSAAVEGLAQSPSLEVIQKIAAATGDDYRLVRVRAAAALAQFPNMLPQGMAKEQLSTATDEYLASLMARPDRWDSHYDLGNFYLAQNRPKEALAEYDEALKREPRSVMVMVNAAMADARLGDTRKAGERLNQALKIAPESAAALFNLGLVEAERGNPAAAERNLKEAFKADSQLAGAAYNLCIITSKDRPAEALEWCTTAVSLRPQEHKYAWTLAYYQQQAGDTASAIAGITRLIGQAPDYADAWLLLGDIHERQGRKGEAKAVYERALNTPGIPPQAKAYIQSRLDALRGGD